MKNQRQQILDYMRENGGITSRDAVIDLGCVDVRKRISEIIRDGTAIVKTPEKAKNRYGKTVKYVRYSLPVSPNTQEGSESVGA